MPAPVLQAQWLRQALEARHANFCVWAEGMTDELVRIKTGRNSKAKAAKAKAKAAEPAKRERRTRRV